MISIRNSNDEIIEIKEVDFYGEIYKIKIRSFLNTLTDLMDNEPKVNDKIIKFFIENFHEKNDIGGFSNIINNIIVCDYVYLLPSISIFDKKQVIMYLLSHDYFINDIFYDTFVELCQQITYEVSYLNNTLIFDHITKNNYKTIKYSLKNIDQKHYKNIVNKSHLIHAILHNEIIIAEYLVNIIDMNSNIKNFGFKNIERDSILYLLDLYHKNKLKLEENEIIWVFNAIYGVCKFDECKLMIFAFPHLLGKFRSEIKEIYDAIKVKDI